MESANLNLTKMAWVQIPVPNSAVVSHRSGGLVLYTASDLEPSALDANTAIIDTSSISQTKVIDGVKSGIWALAVNSDAIVSYTGITTASDTATKYPEITSAGIQTFDVIDANLYTARGLRFFHKFDLTFGSNETKYFLYKTPDLGADFILAIQERNFKSLDDSAELTVLSGSTGYVAATPQTDIQKLNYISNINTQMEIYNLTDVVGNSEPTADGTIIDTDFTIGSGKNNASSGGFSPQIGSKLYPAGAAPILKVTNMQAGANRISLEYSWIELPLSFLE